MKPGTLRRRRMMAIALALLCLLGSAGTGPAIAASGKTFRTLADFEGTKIGSQTGAVFDKYVDAVIPNVEHLYYNDIAGQALGLQSGQVDGIALDNPVGLLLVARQPDLAVFPEYLADDRYGFAFRKGDPLRDEASKVIEQMEADGTAAEMAARWLSADESKKVLPELTGKDDFDGSAGVLRFGYDPVLEPMVYLGEGGQPIGYDIEAMMRIAYALNMELELVPASLSSRIEALLSGFIDVAGCTLSINEEREKIVDFTVPYYVGGMVLIVRASDIADVPDSGEITQVADLAGKQVGIITGSVFDQLLSEQVPDALPVFYSSFTDMIEAVQTGRLDAYIADEPVARVAMGRIGGLKILDEKLMDDNYAIMINKELTALQAAFNRELEAMEADGTMQRLLDKWMAEGGENAKPEEVTLTGENGTLRMASDIGEPFTFVSNNEVVGYEIDIVRILCARLGYDLEISLMDFAGVIPGIVSGKYDIAACCISVTEERQKQVLFSNPTYHGGVVVVVRDAQTASSAGFWESLKDSFYGTFIHEARYKLILSGLWVTIQISAASVVLGTFFGFFVCMMRRSSRRVLQLPARAFIRLNQGIPMVVILLILTYVIFKGARFNPVWIAIIGFTLNFMAYAAEIMRTGIDAVDRGQLEAAAAIGFSPVKVFFRIVFPQATRHVLPVYKSEIISLVKASSIVGYIAIMDLTKASDIIRSRTFDAFFPLLTTALIYFLLANLLASVLGLLEKKIDPKRRKRTLRGVTLK